MKSWVSGALVRAWWWSAEQYGGTFLCQRGATGDTSTARGNGKPLCARAVGQCVTQDTSRRILDSRRADLCPYTGEGKPPDSKSLEPCATMQVFSSAARKSMQLYIVIALQPTWLSLAGVFDFDSPRTRAIKVF